MSTRKTLATFTLSGAMLLPSLVLAEGGPGAIDAFRKLHQEVTRLVDASAAKKDVQTKVDTLLDYDWIAQTALGGPERCTERCDEYRALLAQLMRKNYLKRIHAKDRGTVEYVGEHVRRNATKVDTQVTFTDTQGEKKTVEIDYVMHKVEDAWKVRDIITEGVSLAKNYKYEIDRLYKNGGMDKIIGTLHKKLDEIEAEDAIE